MSIPKETSAPVAKSASAKKMLMGDLMQTVGILPILILIVAVFGFIAPNFFTESNLLNITRQASINIVLAAGMTFIILTGGIAYGAKVIGFGSHIQITNFDSNSSYESQPIAVSDTLLNALDAFPGIRHVEKFATKLGILKTDQDFQGIVLKGVDTDYDWTFFKDN